MGPNQTVSSKRLEFYLPDPAFPQSGVPNHWEATVFIPGAVVHSGLDQWWAGGEPVSAQKNPFRDIEQRVGAYKVLMAVTTPNSLGDKHQALSQDNPSLATLATLSAQLQPYPDIPNVLNMNVYTAADLMRKLGFRAKLFGDAIGGVNDSYKVVIQKVEGTNNPGFRDASHPTKDLAGTLKPWPPGTVVELHYDPTEP